MLALLTVGTLAFGSPARATTVVLLAGAPSHGYGAHEYAAGVEILAEDLRAADLDLDVVTHHGGWPESSDALENADAIVLFMDGGEAHPAREHLAAIGERMERGAGLMAMHYAVEVPAGRDGDAFQRWIGGSYEAGWSTNPHWAATASLDDSHPIARGVASFEAFDEWYFNIRFRPGMKGVTPVLTAVPDDDARSGETSWPRGPMAHITEASGHAETLLWAAERPDGGRGVGFTGGHFHWNWADDDYRRLVLNAIVWTAGREVPLSGVPTPRRTLDDLMRLEPASLLKRVDKLFRFDPDEVRRRFGHAPEARTGVALPRLGDRRRVGAAPR